MRHVIVTGGSRGLGLALVQGLLEEGYRVSTCSRSPGEALERLAHEERYEGRLLWRPCILGKASEAERFVGESMVWAGSDGLYGLINNAGIAREGVLATFPNAAMEEILEINLLGALQMARLALRHLLRAQGGGRIINISSIIGLRGYTGLAAYAATKAGMDGMTRALAREVGPRGITVNSVAPGYLSTEMSSTLGDRQTEQIVRRTPLGRLGEPADVLPVVRFLLRDEARFITGQTICVDGGISC
jgi:3-oxoacyl-[acyl-carrier protein] reductase